MNWRCCLLFSLVLWISPSNGSARVLESVSAAPSAELVQVSPSPPPSSLPQIIHLPLKNVNILVVTDVHSWVGGHGRHLHHTDADYGDVFSFAQQIKRHCESVGKDFWFVMNGDFVHGTMLGVDPPEALIPIIEHMPWDAVTLGNHELQNSLTVRLLLEPGGIADFWGHRLVTSNVIITATGQHFGRQYNYLHGNHAKLLVFGFVYDMGSEATDMVTVLRVEDVVESAWFETVVSAKDYDGILILAHMDVNDVLVDLMFQKIRALASVGVPLHFITGHTHYRGYTALDDYSTSFEAGRYLDTVGFVSFTNNPGDYDHRFLNASKAAFRNVLGHRMWKTPEGYQLSAFISRIQESVGSNEVLGCSPIHFRADGYLNETDSLVRLYIEEVMQQSFLLPHENNEGNNVLIQDVEWFLRYDLFAGNTTMDDLVGIITEDDVIYKVASSFRGDNILRLQATLNGARTILNGTAMAVLLSTADGEPIRGGDIRYELYTTGRDLTRVLAALSNLHVQHPKQEIIDNGRPIRTFFQQFLTENWQRYPCEYFEFRPEEVVEETPPVSELNDTVVEETPLVPELNETTVVEEMPSVLESNETTLVDENDATKNWTLVFDDDDDFVVATDDESPHPRTLLGYWISSALGVALLVVVCVRCVVTCRIMRQRYWLQQWRDMVQLAPMNDGFADDAILRGLKETEEGVRIS